MGGIQWRRWQVMLILFLLCVAMYILFSNMSLPRNLELSVSKWQPYIYKKFREKQWFEKTCIDGRVPGALEELPNTLEDWRQSNNAECRDLYLIFIKMFKVKYQEGTVVLPGPFSTKVKSWLGNKQEVFQQIYNQSIISIRNLYTREENTFNPLRSKRPMSIPKVPERQYIEELAHQTQQSCDFCKYKDNTAMDELGRIDNELSYSAANTFKLDRWHSLIMLKTHHPLNWTREQFLDMMATKSQWFTRVYKHDVSYNYPSAIWDLLPHAGASQVHPHLHGFLDTENYQGTMELWRRAALDYNKDFPKHNFFSDLSRLHTILGLSVTYGTAVAFANIVPRKDNEIVIVSEKADKDFYLLWYFVIRGFLDDMGSGNLCFSSGIAFPSMSGDTSSRSLPAYVRIVTRGAVADIRSDFSSLELFTSTNANTDQYKVIQVMRESVRKRGTLVDS